MAIYTTNLSLIPSYQLHSFIAKRFEYFATVKQTNDKVSSAATDGLELLIILSDA
jgi:hypothetical protein